MQAVILAGGKGTRLRPLTYKKPKVMLLIGKKPFLQYQLELLKSCGINNILILVGYLAEQIKDYFGNGSDFGFKISYSREEKPLGTGGALKKAEKKLDDLFLLLNGDTYLPIDYKNLVRFFRRLKALGVITACKNSDKIVPSNVKVGTGSLVLGYSKKDERGMDCLDAGAMVLSKKVTELIRENKKVSLEEEIFPKLIKLKSLYAYTVNHKFYDMGSFRGLRLLKERLK